MNHKLFLSPLLLAFACGGGDDESFPTFRLSWSEYPAWSLFGVAHEIGLIDGRRGQMGPLEAEWSVDLELERALYGASVAGFATAGVDAACLTNVDALRVSLSRKSVALLPTSTSNGADALVAVGCSELGDLEGQRVLGLAASMSQYVFERNLELAGLSPTAVEFVSTEPAVAAETLLASEQCAIVVRNPRAAALLAARDDAEVIFDSSTLPGEVLDLVVVGADSLEREGGDRFARCLLEVYYTLAARLQDPARREDLLFELAKSCPDLDLAGLERVLASVELFDSPAKALTLYRSGEAERTMTTVADYCAKHGFLARAPSLAFAAAADVDLCFDPSWLERALQE